MKNEIILCAAIWFDDGLEYKHQPKNISRGYVVSGYRHSSIYALKKHDRKNPAIEGFLTSHNRFLDRVQSFDLAKINGQIKSDDFDIADSNVSNELYSENLY